MSTRVVPCSLSRNSRSHRMCRACGSSPVVGSSSSRMRGSLMSARAIVRRRFMPPERSSTLALALSSAARTRAARRPGPQAARRAGRSSGRRRRGSRAPELRVEVVRLRHDAQLRRGSRGRAVRVEAEDAQVAARCAWTPRRSSAWWSTCPRRWGRAGRRTPPARPRRRCRRRR